MPDFFFVALVMDELFFPRNSTCTYISQTTISKANRAKIGLQLKPIDLYRHIYLSELKGILIERSIKLKGTLGGGWGGADFPGGPVVKNPPFNAGDAGSIPGQGTKIPYAAAQLGPRTTTIELACLNGERPHAANYRAHAPWNPRAWVKERKPARHN